MAGGEGAPAAAHHLLLGKKTTYLQAAYGHQQDAIHLPPGFRFHPTDEELITHYLSMKVSDSDFIASAVGEVDLNKCEPWDLPKRAKMGEKEWYFFCMNDRKYPTGMRTNRATESGYWKATGKDKEIYRGKTLVGMKKTLVFYTGRAPKGEKSEWVMHEYRQEEGRRSSSQHSLPKTNSARNEWVICRVFNKNSSCVTKALMTDGFVDQLHQVYNSNNGVAAYSLPPLIDLTYTNNITSSTIASPSSESAHVTCFSNINAVDQGLRFSSASFFTAPANNYFSDTGGVGSSLLQLLQSSNINGRNTGEVQKDKLSISPEAGLSIYDFINNSEISTGVVLQHQDGTAKTSPSLQQIHHGDDRSFWSY